MRRRGRRRRADVVLVDGGGHRRGAAQELRLALAALEGLFDLGFQAFRPLPRRFRGLRRLRCLARLGGLARGGLEAEGPRDVGARPEAAAARVKVVDVRGARGGALLARLNRRGKGSEDVVAVAAALLHVLRERSEHGRDALAFRGILGHARHHVRRRALRLFVVVRRRLVRHRHGLHQRRQRRRKGDSTDEESHLGPPRF
mmetsp:Transcript_720/g.2328  ORF Transcript_720/g.2328 Transcript_720/m.2328 type:complete len:201 (-) Transcript_720:976-1578(-)